MDSEQPEDFHPALSFAEDDQQEIGGLINSDGEEVDFSHLGGQMKGKEKSETLKKLFINTR